MSLGFKRLKKLEYSRVYFEKYSKINFHENRCSRRPVVPFGRTDRHDDAKGRFSKFCERNRNDVCNKTMCECPWVILLWSLLGNRGAWNVGSNYRVATKSVPYHLRSQPVRGLAVFLLWNCGLKLQFNKIAKTHINWSVWRQTAHTAIRRSCCLRSEQKWQVNSAWGRNQGRI